MVEGLSPGHSKLVKGFLLLVGVGGFSLSHAQSSMFKRLLPCVVEGLSPGHSRLINGGPPS